MTAHRYAFTLERLYPHLNYRWSMADMDKIEALANKRMSADQIAFLMDCTSVEVMKVCERNGIRLWNTMRAA